VQQVLVGRTTRTLSVNLLFFFTSAVSHCTARSDDDIDHHHCAVDFVIEASCIVESSSEKNVEMGAPVFHSEQCIRSTPPVVQETTTGRNKACKRRHCQIHTSVSILFLPRFTTDNNACAKKSGAAQEPDKTQRALRQDAGKAHKEGALAVYGQGDDSGNRSV
jgi:hypothetical protein